MQKLSNALFIFVSVALLALSLTGCGLGRYRLIGDGEMVVRSRINDVICQRAFTDITEDGVEDVYASPCDVGIKRFSKKLPKN